MASDRAREAGPLYERAAALAPESHELLFWAGLAQAHAGDPERGIAAVRRAIELHPGWRDAARAALAGLRPRGGARPARAGLELASADHLQVERAAVVAGRVALVDADLVGGRAGLDAQREVRRVADGRSPSPSTC